MLNLKAVAGLGLICFAVLFFPPFLNVHGSESSPSQVVQHWLTVYPKDLDTAVTLTTTKMRNNLTPDRWINNSKSALANLGLEILDGQVLSEEVTGNRAIVTLKVYLSTTIGEQVQRERYTLRRIDGQWLIDDLKVVAERFLGEVM